MTRRQFGFFLAKFLFAVVVLIWLLKKTNPDQVWEVIRGARVLPVLVGIVLCWLTVLIAGWRWQRLLRILEINIPLTSLICITQIGQFFLMFLPGPVGDDLTRILYVSRLAPGRVGEACTTVLMDRCIGLTSIFLLSVFCIPIHWQLLASTRQTYLLALAILVLGCTVCMGGAVFLLLSGGVLKKISESVLHLLPDSKIRTELIRVASLICLNKRTVLQVVAAALGTQLLVCLLFYLAGRSVGIEVPPSIWFGFVPIVLAANAVPITIAGIGVREYLLILFLGVLAQINGDRAFAASLVAFFMMLVVCLAGGVVYIFYRPKVLPVESAAV